MEITWQDIRTGFNFVSVENGKMILHFVCEPTTLEDSDGFNDLTVKLDTGFNRVIIDKYFLDQEAFETTAFYDNHGTFPEKGSHNFFIWVFTGKITQ
jgi:hypothetical protein